MSVVKHLWCWMVSLSLSLRGFSLANKAGISKRPGQKEHLSSYQQVDMHGRKTLVTVDSVNNQCSYVT